jgi:hypothetical protein
MRATTTRSTSPDCRQGHKVTIALVDANHRVFAGQVVTVNFTVPASANAQAHRH